MEGRYDNDEDCRSFDWTMIAFDWASLIFDWAARAFDWSMLPGLEGLTHIMSARMRPLLGAHLLHSDCRHRPVKYLLRPSQILSAT